MTGGPAVHRASRWLRKAAQFVTLAYWWPAIGVDLWSLLRWGFSESSAQRTVRMLLIESIVYLAIWSLVSTIAAAAGAAPAERRRRRPGHDHREDRQPLRPSRGR